ncbi:TRAP transporter large permease [Desulfococcus multivorans]|uniref:TRAP dicarboxylate transporter, DctM subunit n=1 Tax=Desulfococcus multivorans DSM 2059 TaxID=1121405 RepID=S7TN85_DESML|nr:TRAP transporter large permease subunit [Desulfococcus multivorans]AOY59251.1 DctM4: C4-TRAP dicarboxylate transport system permease [Desulfococcus multivorans]AQV01473.1 C4-dicarboxylate ABC transporter permease [Desulfococcus multivorans]EPR38642.1 TRAP dicarboxylate transporter, DctM subunit [Desulfococcus multivorans DSM 2059]SKA26655.1 C4-dicarboxylate transporter, DctM subunit [Desulfococcus multivorans DSM 2059]
MQISDLIIICILLGCMTTYVPVFLCLFFTAAIGFVVFLNMPLAVLAQTLFRSLDNFSLIVVLFFILCGNIMSKGKTVEKLINLANALVSWLPGGLGMAGVIGCGLFGAISGSAVATVVALGGFMIPALIKNGYDEDYTLGLMTTSPNLGIIIPPSISMIFYSMISNVSLEGLFITGFIPGFIIIVCVCLYTWILYHNRTDIKRLPAPNFRQLYYILKEGFWAIMLIVIIFGGIFTGVFTANEAAVVASVYAFFVEIFIYKAINFKDAKDVTVYSAVTSATLLLIVASATCFGRYLTFENIPNRVAEVVVASIHSPFVFLMAMNMLLLIIGMFMDIISATLILGPVFLPLLGPFNVDPMHFGLIMTVNLAIGYCTPPMGVSLFITGSLANRDIIYVTRAVIPFLAIQIGTLLFLTYFPEMVLFLPRLLGYH